MYNFDEIINRNNTDCIKYDFKKVYNMPEDVLPLWVADMDFKVPDEVIEAMKKRCEHGIFGYTESRESYFEAVKNWIYTNHSWEVKRQYLVKTPGVVFALSTAVKAFTDIGDSVLIQRPVYYPFSRVIEENGRVIVNNSFVLNNGKYEIDFNDFEEKIKKNKVKLFLLCSPHNPVGRVWKKEELIKMADICVENGVIIVSDEIHSDFVWGENKHTTMGVLGKKYADNIVVCTAPSKTFNLAGLQASNIFIPNRELRHKFKEERNKTECIQLNIMALTACEAAYRYGSRWYGEVKEYIYSNIEFTDKFLKENIPNVKLIYPEGTYLLWLDFRNLNTDDEKLNDIMINKAKLWLDGGSIFGDEGKGFQRINVACPRSVLKEALERMAKAVNEI